MQALVAETLVLAAAADSMPTSYVEDGKQVGILVDTVKEAFQRAGYPVEIKLMPWTRCQEDVKRGLVDGIFSVFVTADRQTFLTYTKEVLITQVLALFVRSDSTITFDGDLKKLSGRSIGIISQTRYGARLDEALKEGIFRRIDTASDSELNVKKLLGGRVDMIPSYTQVALNTAKRLGALDQIKQLEPDLEAVPSFLAFSQKRDFTKVIHDYDKALVSMKRDGTYHEIFNRYLQ